MAPAGVLRAWLVATVVLCAEAAPPAAWGDAAGEPEEGARRPEGAAALGTSTATRHLPAALGSMYATQC